MSSFGELLKRERELRQISLREVSEATKINLRYLEMLERNDFRHLPGGVFNKGFVRAYAQYIGVDPEDMINAYLLEERNQSVDAATGPQGDVLRGRRTLETPEKDEESISRGRQRVVVVTVGALIVVAVVVLIVVWITRGFGDLTRSDDPPASTSTPTAPALPVPTGSAPAPSPASADDLAGEPGPPDAAIEDRPAEDDPPPSGAPPDDVAETTAVAREPSVATGPRPSPAEGGAHEVVVIVVRPTSGRVVCDRRVEMLDGRTAGRELRLSCSSVLVVDAEDGGAVHVGIDGLAPVQVGPDRQPVRGRDLLAVSR